MIKALIVDDEQSATEVIKTLVASTTTEIQVCDACSNIKDAVYSIGKHMPDIIFLDIELTDGSGFEILDSFTELRSRIIFVTAYGHYAIKAIKHHAFDYILKPVDPVEFKQVVNRVIAEMRKDEGTTFNAIKHYDSLLPPKIAIPSKNSVEYYPLADIICIEGKGSYSTLHMTNNKSLTATRLIKEFESSLSGNGFLRVHKSYLINIQHIRAFQKEDNGYFMMSNKMEIPLSAKEKDSILSKLRNQYNIIY